MRRWQAEATTLHPRNDIFITFVERLGGLSNEASLNGARQSDVDPAAGVDLTEFNQDDEPLNSVNSNTGTTASTCPLLFALHALFGANL